MSVSVHVQLFADLREFIGGGTAVDVAIAAGDTIGTIVDHLGIPRDRVKIIFLNARSASLDEPVHGGDKLSLFSAIGGG